MDHRVAPLRRLACLFVPDFPAVAAIRAEPCLRGQPVVILAEAAPARIVIAADRRARERGVAPGMTEAEVVARPRSVVCRRRVPEHEQAAEQALLEMAWAHSPRVENAGPGVLYLDLGGLSALFGDEAVLGRRLGRCAADLGVPAVVGIASSRIGARAAARDGAAVRVVRAGEEAGFLAPLPLAMLECSPEMEERLRRWGIRTLGELSALPGRSLFQRLGTEGLRLQRLARGEDARPLQPCLPPLIVEESMELDWTIDTRERLLEVLNRLAERVSWRLAGQDLSTDRIEWSCRRADGSAHAGAITPAVPVGEKAGMVALLRAALESGSPGGPVSGITLRAHPVRITPAQEPLGDPSRPRPRLLTATLARLAALVGTHQVGVPVLLDSHRPDAVRIEPIGPGDSSRPHPAPLPGRGKEPQEPRSLSTPGRGQGEGERWQGALVLRRLRPPRSATVPLVGGRPVQLRSDLLSGRIVASAGPWRSSGEWWTDAPWFHDEWDVELEPGMLCRLVHDGHAWRLEGIYD
jgi:protein ImuB